jgi:hypothetical protein
MGISQQIGASSLIKAGVCTSSTRPATPYEGQVIYETDTDLTYVYSGSTWVSPSFVSTALSGVPTAPTASAGTNTTQLATTAFVTDALGSWQDWTPVPFSSIGAITSYLAGGRYMRIQKMVVLQFSVQIIDKGTGNGTLLIPLPITASTTYTAGLGSGAVGTFAEWTAIGFIGATFLLGGNTQLGLLKYDWTTPVVNGTLSGFAIYEAA